MRIERCREDCHDLSNLQADEEQLFFAMKNKILDRKKKLLNLLQNLQVCSRTLSLV